MMKKTYEAPQTTMVCANPTTLMAASGKGDWEHGNGQGQGGGGGDITPTDQTAPGESFSKGTSFNVWEE